MIKVKVPAVSADLGVGYGCMGIALEEYANVSFDAIDKGFLITGCEEIYCHEDNIIYQAFLEGLNYMKESVSGIHIHVEASVPYAKMIGDKAVYIVAGLAGANAMFHDRMNKYEIFAIATRMEGNSNTVAPAIFGALCVSFMEQEKPNMIKYGFKWDLLFVAMTPNYENMKDTLSNQVKDVDNIQQMGKCTAFAKAIEIGNPMIIKKAGMDNPQELGKQKRTPEYQVVKEVCRKAQSMYISGKGCSMIAITQDPEVAEKIVKDMQERFPAWSTRILHPTYDGVSSEVL